MNKLLLSRFPDLNERGYYLGTLLAVLHTSVLCCCFTLALIQRRKRVDRMSGMCTSYLASHRACLSTDSKARTCSHAHDHLHALSRTGVSTGSRANGQAFVIETTTYTCIPQQGRSLSTWH